PARRCALPIRNGSCWQCPAARQPVTVHASVRVHVPVTCCGTRQRPAASVVP
ncbi:Unknown protein, partial [Striga hermonthica]